ncbi:protein phosphatase 2C domain-containing protein [Streptomyces xiaopingdaonensis]|uniref:protein phosphatase 2C domain-containing protein n=1 Tax=Streptomyces xiaopingdaonensis TaxID=1565415 RepID=UPI000996E522|nr:protein phosphatase 2C domain-containing protein [Streptomyces xiaopingdaonensis]
MSDAVGLPAGGEVSAPEEAVAEGGVGAREEADFPVADPSALIDLLPGTVLDGGRHGACTVRAVSRRGPAAEVRGLPRGEALLTVRFGTGAGALLLVAVAAGPVGIPGAHRAAREACHSIARSVGRSHVRLGEDIRAGRRGALKSGLSRLADRSYGKLRAQAAALGLAPDTYTAELRCLLVPEDPACALRVFFGVGEGGLFRLREGEWQDLEPPAPREAEDPEDEAPGSRLPATGPRYGRTSDDDPRHALGRAWEAPSAGAAPGISDADTLPGDAPLAAADRAAPDPARAAAAVGGVQAEAPHTRSKPYRFRATEARRGDVLLLCSTGLARLLRDDRPLAAHLRAVWKPGAPAPSLPRFFADLDVEELLGRTAEFDETYPEDRTAAAVWESP